MRILYLLLLSLGISSIAKGQIDSVDVNTTPYGVIYNHLYYLQEDSYDIDKAINSLPRNIENPEDIAVRLKRIIDGKGFYVDINRLPQNPNYRDTLSNESIYFIDRDESRIYVEKQNGRWFYSRTTVDQVAPMFKEVFPFGAGFSQYLKGQFWSFQLLGISLAKWFGLILLTMLCVIVFYIIGSLLRLIAIGFFNKRLGILDTVKDEIGKLTRIIALFMVTRLFLYLLPMFQLPIRLHSLLIISIGVLSIFFLILFIVQVANMVFLYMENVTKKTENTLDDQLLPVLRRIVKIIIWSFGIIYILDFLDVNVTALLAGISIGGLAIALAAQDTVKNFFGSIMIFVDRPFQIGDWINFDGVDGTVEEVGVRSTRIRTFANSVVYVPNGMLADKVVNNMGLRQFRRFKTEIGVTYNTPPHKLDLFVKGIREIIAKHPTTKKDAFEVHINSFGPSSINVLIYSFFEAQDWNAELKAKHEIIYAIMILAEELGVSFAFPSQSVYIESFPNESAKKKSSADDLFENSIKKIDAYFAKSHDEVEDKGKIKPLGGE